MRIRTETNISPGSPLFFLSSCIPQRHFFRPHQHQPVYAARNSTRESCAVCTEIPRNLVVAAQLPRRKRPKAQTHLEFQLLADTCTLRHTLRFYCVRSFPVSHACLRAASRSSTDGGLRCSPTFARWLSTMLMVARCPCALKRPKLHVRTMLSTQQPSMDNRGVPW